MQRTFLLHCISVRKSLPLMFGVAPPFPPRTGEKGGGKWGNFSAVRYLIYGRNVFKIGTMPHNAKAIIRADGTSEVIIYDRDIFDVEKVVDNRKRIDISEEERQYKDCCNMQRSVRRAKANISELVHSCKWMYFVTLTLNKERINRYDYDEIYAHLRTFLSNKVSRNNITYVLVPEYHKDGAIHFHGFVSGNIRISDSGKRRYGRPVFNWVEWQYGYSTLIPLEIGNNTRIANYIKKYIGKDMDKNMIGGRYYLHGGKDFRKSKEIIFDFDYNLVTKEAYTFDIPEAGIHGKKLEVENLEKLGLHFED